MVVLAITEMDPFLARGKQSTSLAGGASGKMYLRKGKKTSLISFERGVREM